MSRSPVRSVKKWRKVCGVVSRHMTSLRPLERMEKV